MYYVPSFFQDSHSFTNFSECAVQKLWLSSAVAFQDFLASVRQSLLLPVLAAMQSRIIILRFFRDPLHGGLLRCAFLRPRFRKKLATKLAAYAVGLFEPTKVAVKDCVPLSFIARIGFTRSSSTTPLDMNTWSR